MDASHAKCLLSEVVAFNAVEVLVNLRCPSWLNLASARCSVGDCVVDRNSFGSTFPQSKDVSVNGLSIAIALSFTMKLKDVLFD